MRKMLALTAFAAASLIGNAAHAVIIQFEAILSGLEEVPANASPGTGIVEFDFDNVSNTLTMTSGAFSGLIGSSTVAHVHQAPVGVNGSIIIPITIDSIGATSSTLSMAPTVLTAAQVTALMTAGLYVNVHSNVVPTGEIRGQILQVPAPGALTMLGVAALVGARRRRRA